MNFGIFSECTVYIDHPCTPLQQILVLNFSKIQPEFRLMEEVWH